MTAVPAKSRSPARSISICSHVHLAKSLPDSGLQPELYSTGYAQWESELLNPSFEAVCTRAEHDGIVLVDAEDPISSLSSDAVPTLTDADEQGAAGWARVDARSRRCCRRSSSSVLCHTMVAPPHNGLGILEGNAGFWRPVRRSRRLTAPCARSLSASSACARSTTTRSCEITGWARWHDARLWHVGRMRLANASLSILAQAYTRYLAATHTPRHKCLVLDLDNTLWGGVIGEDGLGGIQLMKAASVSRIASFRWRSSRCIGAA